MDGQRIGRTLRALRQRRNLRQVDVARAASCSQNLISLIERGHVDRVAIRLLARIVAALDSSLVIEIRWRGAALDRLLDEGHATVVAALAERLRRIGWLVEVEVTYSEFGERGSFDLLAFHPEVGMLLVIEVKTDLPSAEATLRKLDEKCRLAPTVARTRFGWHGRNVARLLALPESGALRRRISRHAALFVHSLPAGSVEIRRWLARPEATIAGIWFLSNRDAGSDISRAKSRERVRRPKSRPTNPGIAA